MAPQDARRVAVRLGGAAVIVGFLAGITGCGGDAATGDPGDTVGTIATSITRSTVSTPTDGPLRVHWMPMQQARLPRPKKL